MSGLFGGKQPSVVSSTAPIVASLRVQTSALGRGIPIGFGMARVAGNVIWYGDLTPIAHSVAAAGGSGGKGGGGGSPSSSITYTYTAAILLALGRGQITGVSRVWKDKEKTSLAALGLSLYTGDGAQTAFPHLTTNHPGEALAYRRLAYVASAALDLGEDTRLGNYNFEVSCPPQRGSANQAGKSFTTGTLSTDKLTVAFHGFNPDDRIRLTSTGTLPPPFSPGTDYWLVSPTEISFKLATTPGGAPINITGAGSGIHTATRFDQDGDPTGAAVVSADVFAVQFNSTAHGYALNAIVRVSSSGTLPAGLAAGSDYYVISPAANDFKLSAIPGGEVIAVFSAGGGTHTVIRWVPDADPKDVVEQLLLRAGVEAGRIGDLSAFSNYCVANGIFVSAVYTEPTPTFDLIRDLAAIGNAEVVPSEDKIKIVPYSDAAATGNGVTYTPDNTPIFEFNDDHFLAEGDECPVEIDDEEPADAWNVVKVRFYNRERDYNEDVAEAQDDDHIALFGRRPMPEPVALYGIVDPAVARFVAQVILQNKLYFHCGYRFRLPPGKAELLEPMDLIAITDARLGLSALPVRIMKIEEIEGDRQEGFTFHVREFPAGVASPVLYPAQLGAGFAANFNVAPGDTNTPVIFDAPGALTAGGFEIWIAASGGPNWGGAQIWVATNSGGPFRMVGTIYGRSRHGVLSATFPSGADPDTVNTAVVDLTVSRGELNGGTQADADNESTLAFVDGELISFQDATLTAQYKYDLETYLRRGLHGTPVGAHSAGSPFVRLDQAIGRYAYEPAQVGTLIFVKLQAFNVFGAAPQDLSTLSAFSFTIQGPIGCPKDVTGFTSTFDGPATVLRWTRIVDADLYDYDVRQGAAWATAVPVGRTKSDLLRLDALSVATTFLVKALDRGGKESANAASTTVTPAAPGAIVPAAAFDGGDVKLTWAAPGGGSYPVARYEVRHGATYAGATPVGFVDVTTFRALANWSGSRTWWVTAIDAAGKTGTPGSVEVVVTKPSAPVITPEAIDNNVLLRWTDATQTLPIKHYEIRRGTTFAGATVIGTVQARFSVIFESSAGLYIYWVVGVDSAGNYGTEQSVAVTVSAPPDYVLYDQFESLFAGTKTNCLVIPETGKLLATFNTTETFQQHFDNNSWASPQAQIDAGFPIYIEPSTTTGKYEESIDYGTVIPSTLIAVSMASTVVAGSVTVTPTISHKKLSGDAWTDHAGVWQVYATDFQFVKVTLDFSSSGGDDLLLIDSLSIRLDVKIKRDSGTITANSGDSGGTTVNFNVAFIDIRSITGTPQGTTAAVVVIDFTDVPNPTSFKMLVFDLAGNRITRDVRWEASGA